MARVLILVLMVILAARCAAANEFLEGEVSKGFVLGMHGRSDDYNYEKELRQIAEMGADSILIIVACYQDDITSTEMSTSNDGVPSRERLLDVLRRAHAYNFDVLLQPIVLLRHTKTSKDWRGAIRPESRRDWFANYEKFIAYFAEVARDAEVEALSVGSEFVSMEFFRDSWADVIEKVRSIYPGKLIYSANWDHYEEVAFWDLLDAVGVTSYHTLSKSAEPERDEVAGTWREVKENLLDWQRKIGKPIVFTEIGYPSQKGAAKEPWNYYGSTEVDLDVQVLCLEAFLDVWEDTPEVAAFFIFEWWADGGLEDVDYTPWGKPAEALLRRWFLAR